MTLRAGWAKWSRAATVVLLLGVLAISWAALTPNAQRRGADQIVVEFDLPTEFWQQDARGQYAVTGFRVGFFATATSEPVTTVDIARQTVVTHENIGRIVVTRPDLAAAVSNFVLRIQTVTQTNASPWSEPLLLPGPGTGSSSRSRAPRRRAASVSEVQQHPRLLAALTQLLPDEGERTAAISAFRNLNELAVATAICQQQKVSLERLSKIVAGPPRRSLRRAVRELKPSEAPRSVVQAAQTEAKKLLAEKSP